MAGLEAEAGNHKKALDWATFAVKTCGVSPKALADDPELLPVINAYPKQMEALGVIKK